MTANHTITLELPKLNLHVLTVLFIALKLMSYIHWSWWLILAPSILAVVLWLFAVAFTLWVYSDPLRGLRYTLGR